MDLRDTLELLAAQNISGVAFLGAYGATWIICGLIWVKATERTAAYATLFQGMVAFPIALAVSCAIGAIGQERPVSEEITELSILIGTSQLLGLPLLIYFVVKRMYRLVPFAFAVICSMHFVMYTWLYQTPIYIVMAALISLGTTATMLTAPNDTKKPVGAIRVSLLTGAILLVAGLVFLISWIW